MLKKGKGALLGQLNVVGSIEGDLQLITRLHAGSRNDKNIKGNNRLLTFNF